MADDERPWGKDEEIRAWCLDRAVSLMNGSLGLRLGAEKRDEEELAIVTAEERAVQIADYFQGYIRTGKRPMRTVEDG